MSQANKIPPISHHSDGSELIPSEVPLEIPVDANLSAGYVQDEEGIINNYAVETPMVARVKPSSEKMIVLSLGTIAIFFLLLWVVSGVS